MSRPLRAALSSEQVAGTRSGDAPSTQTLSTPALPSPVREAPPSQAHGTSHTGRIYRRRWAIIHPLQVRMLSIVLGYSLSIFIMLAIPLFQPLMQALDDRSLSWQEKALIANDLINLHDRYWPWALGAGLVLVIHCVHSMLAMYHVAGPLYRLTTVFLQIGQGNLSIRTTLRKGDFLTSEVDLVNQMTAQLQAKISAIKMAQATVALDIDRLKQVSATVGDPTMAEIVKQTEQNLADLKASLDSFKTHKG